MPHRRIILPSLFLALVLGGSASAEEKPRFSVWDAPVSLDQRTVHGELDNGLRWLAHPTEEPSGVLELRLVVAAGSIHEAEDQLGAAHFVEHMAFNQTRRFSPGELRRFLETSGARFGADFNAVTDFHHTTYRLSIPSDDPALREQAFEILADWASGIVFDPAEVERERGVVLAELDQKRRTPWGDWLELAPTLFGGSRYGERPPIGNRASLESLDAATLERYFDTWYRPERMTLVVAGDLDPADFEERLRRHFGGLRGKGEAPDDSWPLPSTGDPTVRAVSGGDGEPPRVLMFHLVPRPGLGRGNPTLGAFRQALIDELALDALQRALAEEVEWLPWFGPERIPAVATFWVSRRGREFEGLAMSLERIRRHGLPQTILERARSNVLGALERALDGESSAKLIANRYAAQAAGAPVPADSVQGEAWKALSALLNDETVSARAQELVAAEHRRTLVVGGVEAAEKVVEVSETFVRSAGLEDLRPLIDPLARPRQTSSGPEIDSSAVEASTMSDTGVSVEENTVPARARQATFYDGIALHLWDLADGTRVLFRRTRDPAARLVAWRPGGVAALAVEDRSAALLLSPLVPGVSATFGEDFLRQRSVLHPQISAHEADLVGASPRLLLRQIGSMASVSDFVLGDWRRQEVIRHLEEIAASAPWRVHERLTVELLTRRSRRTMPPFETLAQQLGKLRPESAAAVLRPAFDRSERFVVVIAGDFEPEEIRALVEEHTGAAEDRADDSESMPDTLPGPLLWPEGSRGSPIEEPRTAPNARVLDPIVLPAEGEQARVQRLSHFELAWTPASERELGFFAHTLQVLAREHLREALGITYQVEVEASLPLADQGPAWISIGFGTAPSQLDPALGGVQTVVEFLLDAPDPTSALQPLLDQALEASAAQVPDGPPEAEGASGFWVGQLIACYRAGIDPHRVLEAWQSGEALSEERFRYLARRWLGSERSALGVARPGAEN